jgi:hypothetical protein
MFGDAALDYLSQNGRRNQTEGRSRAPPILTVATFHREALRKYIFFFMEDRVFISHSVIDKDIANATVEKLEAAGIRCWIAPRDIRPGVPWGAAIMAGIKTSRVMILIFSRNSNASYQVLQEVERAVHHKVPLLPVQIEAVEPSAGLELYLGPRQRLDAIGFPYEHHLDRVLEATRRLIGQSAGLGVPAVPKPAATPVTPPANQWITTTVVSLGAVGLIGLLAWTVSAVSPEAPPPPVTTPGLAIVESPMERLVGDSFTLHARTRAATPTPVVGVRWSSEDSTVVRVIGDTLLRAVGAGAAFVRGEVGTDHDSVRITVRLPARVPTIAALGIARQAPILVGARVQLVATAMDSSGEVLTWARPKWTSSRPTIVRVDSTGIATGVGVGRSIITAQVGAVKATADLLVRLSSLPPVLGPPAGSGATGASDPARPAAGGLRTLADECVAALVRRDAAWLTSHYAASSIGDQTNLRTLTDLLNRQGYRVSDPVVAQPEIATGTVDLQVSVRYRTAFGPLRSLTVPFKVNASPNGSQWRLSSCRVVGVLKLS